MNNMQDALKGMLYVIGGTVLLLHTLNIMKESLQYILIAASIVMILYGVLKSGIVEYFLNWLQRTRATRAVTKER